MLFSLIICSKIYCLCVIKRISGGMLKVLGLNMVSYFMFVCVISLLNI